MVDKVVSDASSLTSALQSAASGDRILLAPGNYGAVSISGLAAPGVTITSQDTSNEAVFTGLNVANSSGITLSYIEVAKNAAPGTFAYAATISGSSKIALRNMNIHGSLDSDPTDDMNGVKIAGSDSITVDHTEIKQFLNGMAIGGSSNISITHNNIHDVESDGIDVTTTKNIKIDANQFHDFHHLPADHSDAIQFFTLGQPAASSGIVITNNEIYQAAGTPMQGIFITDGTGVLPYSNIMIKYNSILGGNWNSIYVDHSTDATVRNNYAAPLNIINSQTGTPMLAQVVMKNIDSLTMTGNHGSVYVYSNLGDSNFAGNTLTDAVDTARVGQAITYWSQITNQPIDLTNIGPAGLTVKGTSGADLLVGSSSNDSIYGGAGNDTIIGAGSGDHLVGGDGADLFVFKATTDSPTTNPDVIADFNEGEGDKIDLSAMDAKVGGVDDPFTIVKYFTHHAGELTLAYNVDHVEIRGDVNGDGVADFQINVNMGKMLSSGDFVF
jgi:Ca2+-binding RTX toxin-like protein